MQASTSSRSSVMNDNLQVVQEPIASSLGVVHKFKPPFAGDQLTFRTAAQPSSRYHESLPIAMIIFDRDSLSVCAPRYG